MEEIKGLKKQKGISNKQIEKEMNIIDNKEM